ncbi:vascular endothelial growth factor receptor 1-like [Copidosoma floridanum]|uniref:vascular endothelial growth factor receptor 1-like n=1 Tax=Copidosoma floridanum TaxID=29053 RepID=UPI0006C98C97|nr:vascular endothelial growth factor receptor 1-like [Copidosoma floridanum]
MSGPQGRGALWLLLALALLSAGCLGHKPQLQPNVKELEINEGEALEITCTSFGDVNFYYPEDDKDDNITTSEHKISRYKSDDSVEIKFQRRSTVFGDTGWYGCANVDGNVTSKDYDDPNASWTYVYVNSNESAFIQIFDGYVIRYAHVGNRAILPCRPTSPRFHVNLKAFNKNLKPSERITFDPKIGFVIENTTILDSDYYTCETDEDVSSQVIYIYLLIINKDSLKKPIIKTDGLEHVTAGSTLSVKCVVEMGIENPYSISWKTPRNSTSRIILDPVHEEKGGVRLVTSELIENNVTYDDEGEYTCQVKAPLEITSTNVYIKIHDPYNTYINLTSDEENRHYIVHADNSVTFSAHVNAYPTPTLTWLGTNGKKISSGNKFTVTNVPPATSLTIHSVQIQDMGIYTLQANNDVEVKHLNFSLEVHAKPWALLDTAEIKSFYGFGENATFVCQALGYPMSNISWFFTSCPKFQSEDDCEKSELKGTETIGQSNTTVNSKVTTNLKTFGRINCTACNVYACDSVEQNVFITDGVPDASFGIIEPEGKLTVGDNVTLVCAAVNYNFSSVMWLSDQGELVANSERINVTSEDTKFTHRSVLTIRNVQPSDQLDYYCEATDFDYQTNKISYFLALEDPKEPYFINVNMNDTEVTLSSREAHNSIYLLCYVGGMPKPNVSWYKNDAPLELSEQQYNLVSDNQELIIKYMLESDSGKYACVARNRFGSVQRSQKFIVKGVEKPWLWIGMIVCLIIVLTVLLIYFCLKVRHEKLMRKQLLEAGLTYFEEGALDCINPELMVDDQAELLPYDRKWEFPREKVKLGKQLGSGAFGVVMKAEAYGIIADEPVTTVAVKMVRKSAEPVYIRALASELKIMVHLGKHLNVVNLLGACTKNIAKRELLVIVEFCRFGNLQNYLLRHRENFIDQIDPSTGKIDPSIGKESKRIKHPTSTFPNQLSTASSNSEPSGESVVYCADTQNISGPMRLNVGFEHSDSQPGWRSNYEGDYKEKNLEPICSQDLLSWAFQVARGMEYLSRRKVLHGDLAARNILLAENNVVKICDFGLAKTMYKDDNYKKQGNGPVPVKWMAIESIRDQVFSTKSDIWSFGIVLWEFFTLAEIPYPGMEVEKQYQKLVEGYRMEQPAYATKDIYDIMLRCWKAKPSLRPSFTELVESIGDLLEDGVKMHYVELNYMYESMNKASNLEGKNDYLSMMLSPDHVEYVPARHDYMNGSPRAADPAYLTVIGDSPRNVHSEGEDTPMLTKIKTEPEQDEDNYLKPIDINKKREEFMKQREAERKKDRESGDVSLSTDRDSGYCNAPKNMEVNDNLRAEGKNKGVDDTDKPTIVIPIKDNYVNIHQRETERSKYRSALDTFMNPSYLFVESANLNSTDVPWKKNNP